MGGKSSVNVRKSILDSSLKIVIEFEKASSCFVNMMHSKSFLLHFQLD